MKNAKRVIVILLVNIILVLSVFSTAQAAYLWKWFNTNGSYNHYKYLSNNLGSSYGGPIDGAFNAWNNVKDSSGNNIFPLSRSSSGTNGSIEFLYNSGATWLGKVNVTQYETGSTTYIKKVVIYLNDYHNLSISALPGYYSIPSILTHEVGHVLGLMHCHEVGGGKCSSSTCTSNVLQPSLNAGVTRTTLQTFDKNAKTKLYP